MKSPADMGTIQIDLTNACNKTCSNCTRFCGNHAKPFFMDFDTFKNAVDSLEGFHGITGIMGGEPTLHPEFERFVLYLKEQYGEPAHENRAIYPIRHFVREMRWREDESNAIKKCDDGKEILKCYGPGLFSNMGQTYRKHYELIQDVFEIQYLNDHINASYHRPALVSRKDLGIPDEEWIKLRDNCWIQLEWSASITPKGAFFCEVAGALDMLFNGPGGWPVEKGWWKRTPEEFGDQLHWCEICGLALDTFMRNANEGIDDASPTLYEMLSNVDSPKFKAGKVHQIKIENGVIAEESKANGQFFTRLQPYIEHFEDRFNQENTILSECDYADCIIPDGESFGKLLEETIRTGEKDWILVKGRNDTNTDVLDSMVGKYILNPGTLHTSDGYVLFHRNAMSLRNMDFEMIHSRDDLIKAWIPQKVINLSDTEKKNHLRCSAVIPGAKYAIWGSGICGEFMDDVIKECGGIVSCVVDVSEERQGCDFRGNEIFSPDVLKSRDETDLHIAVGHLTRYDEIKEAILAMGYEEDHILMPETVLSHMPMRKEADDWTRINSDSCV